GRRSASQHRPAGQRGRPADGVRPRLRVRPEHVAPRLPRLRGRPPGRPVRPRRRGPVGPVGVRRGPPRLARWLRARRPRHLRGPRPARRRLRGSLGLRRHRRARGDRGAGQVLPARPRQPVTAVHRRRRLPGRVQHLRHRGHAGVARQQLPRLVDHHGAGDHGQRRTAPARRGAHGELLPHRPAHRPALRPRHLHLRQPRRPVEGDDADPGAPVHRGRHRAGVGRRVRPRRRSRCPDGAARGDRSLSEPERSRGDSRRHRRLPADV
ncbi:MAG: Hydrolase of unknown specificity RsbQ, part of a novel [RsbQ - PAS domain] bacterial sensing module, partial [uncultured Nocardioidaceae bacterium]